ncbi:MAG: hypothetical protein M3011_04810 [Actinomycetota bacterium]|nr:hypothetical protein [Actinomycetota bacterium]
MKQLAQHNVVATFPDMEAARSALDDLTSAGIEAEDISLLGRAVDEARNETDTRLRDMEATGEIAKRAGTGVAAGSAIGALAGVAAFAIPGVGPVIGGGILAGVIGGGIAGGSVGGMVGGVAGLSLEDDWDLTFQDSIRAGRVLLAVHAADKDDVEKAAEILKGKHPDRLDWLDAEGKKMDDGSEPEEG